MSRLDYPIRWAVGSTELVLNNHRTDDGEIDDAALAAGYYQVESYDFSPLDIREQREAYHLATGGDFGPANRTFRHMAMRGVINAPSSAKLDDMEAAFLAAFDIERAQLENPTQEGLGTLQHTAETTLSAPGITSRVKEGFYCRPESYPVTYDRRGPRGIIRAFAAQLVSGYPYRILFPAESVTFSPTAGWTHALPNWPESVAGTSRLRLIVTHTGAGSPSLTFSDGTTALVLDMSSAGSSVLYIDMWTGQIYSATAPRGNLRTSDVDSFFGVPPAGCTMTVSNTTNIASVVATYHKTRA